MSDIYQGNCQELSQIFWRESWSIPSIARMQRRSSKGMLFLRLRGGMYTQIHIKYVIITLIIYFKENNKRVIKWSYVLEIICVWKEKRKCNFIFFMLYKLLPRGFVRVKFNLCYFFYLCNLYYQKKKLKHLFICFFLCQCFHNFNIIGYRVKTLKQIYVINWD